MRARTGIALLALCAAVAAPGAARAFWDPTLDTIYWRTDCSGFSPLECVKSPEDVLNFNLWMNFTRKPSEASPLLVDVGPGQFWSVHLGQVYYATLDCLNISHVTWRGAGPGITVIGGTDLAGLRYPISASGCHNLHVQDMTLASPDQGVWWSGPGSSTWQNVEIIGQKQGWFDASCPANRPVHYFFNTQIRTNGEGGVFEAFGMDVCSENWLYGSEVSALGSASSSSGLSKLTAIRSRTATGDVRLFGSAVRAGSGALDPGHAAFQGATGVKVSNGGVLHIHGSVVNATTSSIAGADATGLSVSGSGSFAHTPGTAFVVKPGSGGSATRVAELGSSKVESPFLWQAGSEPPVADLASADGADVYVETDCDASGNCDAAGNETHVMIYNQAKCGAANPWFDSTVGACRP